MWWQKEYKKDKYLINKYLGNMDHFYTLAKTIRY